MSKARREKFAEISTAVTLLGLFLWLVFGLLSPGPFDLRVGVSLMLMLFFTVTFGGPFIVLQIFRAVFRVDRAPH